MNTSLIFYQLFEAESSTYTYILADDQSREAVIVDPVRETVERDLRLLSELELKLCYILDTHVHADHVTGAEELRQRTGAKTGVSRHAAVSCADLNLTDGQVIRFGTQELRVIETPGHTPCCLCFLVGDRLLTGDTLLIRGTGRTDFQHGSAESLFRSVREKLFVLPADTKVYPGHDYKGQTMSTLALEMKWNPRVGLQQDREGFLKIMRELNLPPPKKLAEAVPANMQCGKKIS